MMEQRLLKLVGESKEQRQWVHDGAVPGERLSFRPTLVEKDVSRARQKRWTQESRSSLLIPGKKKNGDGRGLKGDYEIIMACKDKAFCSRKPNTRAARSSLWAPHAVFLHFHPEHQARLPPLKAESSVLSGFQYSAHRLLIILDFKQSGFGMSLTYQLSLYLSAFTKI